MPLFIVGGKISENQINFYFFTFRSPIDGFEFLLKMFEKHKKNPLYLKYNQIIHT